MEQGMFIEKLVKRKKRGVENLLSFMIVLNSKSHIPIIFSIFCGSFSEKIKFFISSLSNL